MSGREKICEQLSAYLDGELSEDESRRIAEMVAGDPELSAELESLRAVRSLLRGLPPVHAPDGMADAVLKRTRRRPAGWWMGYLARAAIVLLAIGVGITVTTLLKSPTHTRREDRQTPHVEKTPVLAKGRITGPGCDEATMETTNVFINTDNLLLTQREVERVFVNNSIKPIVETAGKPMDAPASRGRGNFYNQTQVTPKQIRYEVAITDNQMRQIVSELNEIRAKQNVAQMPARGGVVKDGEALDLVKAVQSKSAMNKTEGYAAYMREEGRKRSVEKTWLDRKSGGHVADKVGVRVGKTASQPELAPAIMSGGSERERKGLAAAKPAGAAPTTMPASVVAGQRITGGIRDLKSSNRQPTTMASANVRQLIVIVNGVSGRE
ncbi:MAG: hypothetical protein SVV80_05260 [Planctomycetota bacterium]|nr:hypothetical protein [Planctomycetota bacterium]